jgi:protocatechuate 3,4-dioxygenase beta subunit
MKPRFILLGIVLIILIGYVVIQLKSNSERAPEASNTNPQPSALKRFEDCPLELTPSQTEGPFYKANTPMKNILVEKGIPGIPIVISGFVFDQNCAPIAGAWLDFWQADDSGNYDNSGYKLRGHQFTDSTGKYTLKTVIPGEYPGRTPHIHVKVSKNANSPVLTSQIYFPMSSQNNTDTIFSSVLLVKMSADQESATFNFKIQ